LEKQGLTQKTVVSAWISALTKDPRIWPDAEAFVPERWLGNYKGAEVDRKAFLPFSGASRSCIGQQYDSFYCLLIMAY
jgi:cytochrome P450